MRMKNLDWKEYGIELKKRPSPFDFPAFEHEDHMKESPRTITKQDESVTKLGDYFSLYHIFTLVQQSNEIVGTKVTASTDTTKNAKPVADPKEPKKENVGPKEHNKKSLANAVKDDKKPRRVSRNQEMDECSLE